MWFLPLFDMCVWHVFVNKLSLSLYLLTYVLIVLLIKATVRRIRRIVKLASNRSKVVWCSMLLQVLFVPGNAFMIDSSLPCPYLRASFSIATAEQINTVSHTAMCLIDKLMNDSIAGVMFSSACLLWWWCCSCRVNWWTVAISTAWLTLRHLVHISDDIVQHAIAVSYMCVHYSHKVSSVFQHI